MSERESTQLDAFIRELARDLPPGGGRPRRTVSAVRFYAGWIAFGACVALAAWLALPLRQNLAQMRAVPYFARETALWLLLGLGAMRLVYVSSVPGRSRTGSLAFTGAAAALWVVAVLSRATPAAGFVSAVRSEFQLYRTPCAALILALASAFAGFGVVWARRAAVTRPAFTAAAIAVASGAFGTVLMQTICTYDNPAHLLVWHVAPTLLLATGGALLGRRALDTWPRPGTRRNAAPRT